MTAVGAPGLKFGAVLEHFSVHASRKMRRVEMSALFRGIGGLIAALFAERPVQGVSELGPNRIGPKCHLGPILLERPID